MSKINWIEISSINEIPKFKNNYIVIFKHSTQCIVSKIANKYDVYHESPQLILLKDDKVLHHSSHADIKFSNLNDYVT